jgi:peptide chain release factor 1
MWDKLEAIEKRYLELEQELAKPEVVNDLSQYAKLSRDYAELTDIVTPYRRALKLRAQLEQSREELAATRVDDSVSGDSELRELLRSDIEEKEAALAALELELKALVSPKDPLDRKNCIVEIRAGAGGDEAALFAGDLLRMYTAFALRHNWTAALLDATETGLNGFKEVVLEVRGRGAYGWLRFESGVHRVQRVPVTESSGRIHTSTATVAVLPEVDDVEVEVKESEIRIDVYRSSGAGGQHVNKTSSAIRITHIPTGMVVTCQDERSQLQNKEKALRVLKSKLYQMELERQQSEVSDSRRSQVGSGDRSEKIRTYNFPDSRIVDHRIGMKVHDLERFFAGELDAMLSALRTFDEGERLSRL